MDTLPTVRPGDGFNLLEGVRVVDLSTSVAGPYGTMLLADLGAEIIKVERPGVGDDARTWGPPFLEGESLWFTAVNRGKKSVVLDLTSAEGHADLMRLVRSADVFFTNQPPRVQKKLRLDPDSITAEKPDIIFAAITGFGLDGARADLTCYDLIAEGYSGIMDVTGATDSPPQKIGAPAADMLAGQDAAMAVIAALFHRARTGKGHVVDVALVESMARFLTPRMSSYLGSGEVPTRSGGTDSVIAIYQAFETSDLPMTLGLGTDGIWERFCTAVGLERFLGQDAYSSNSARREKRVEIVTEIQKVLLTHPRAHWLDLFRKARVPAGPINRVDDVTHDGPLQERGLFFTLDDGRRRLPQVGLGIHVDGQHCVPRALPPEYGRHTEEVLSALSAESADPQS